MITHDGLKIVTAFSHVLVHPLSVTVKLTVYVPALPASIDTDDPVLEPLIAAVPPLTDQAYDVIDAGPS